MKPSKGCRTLDSVVFGELCVQPASGELPVTLDRPFGDFEQFGDLADLKSPQGTQADDFGLAGVERFEFCEQFVHPINRPEGRVLSAAEGEMDLAGPPLFRRSPSLVVEHHVGHHLRDVGEEVGSVLEGHMASQNAEKPLVHQSAGLESQGASLRAVVPEELPGRHSFELFVDELCEAFDGLVLSFSRGLKQESEIVIVERSRDHGFSFGSGSPHLVRLRLDGDAAGIAREVGGRES